MIDKAPKISEDTTAVRAAVAKAIQEVDDTRVGDCTDIVLTVVSAVRLLCMDAEVKLSLGIPADAERFASL